jgi:hypothetical protein
MVAAAAAAQRLTAFSGGQAPADAPSTIHPSLMPNPSMSWSDSSPLSPGHSGPAALSGNWRAAAALGRANSERSPAAAAADAADVDVAQSPVRQDGAGPWRRTLEDIMSELIPGPADPALTASTLARSGSPVDPSAGPPPAARSSESEGPALPRPEAQL